MYDKTNYITTRIYQNNFTPIHEIKVNDASIQNKSIVEFPGVTIKQHFNRESHCLNLKEQINKIVGLIFHAA